MKCPTCGYMESKVLDSRPADGSIRRRRECLGCQRRFTTYERIEETPVMVVKKDGSRQLFDRNKIRDGIMHACQKRPVDADAIATAIETELQNSLITEISSKQLGELVLAYLKEEDIVSYIRFASVYREFRDIDSFMEEIKSLSRQLKKKSAKAT